MKDNLATFENVKIGDILYATYSNTRISHRFYKVLEKHGKSTLVLQKLEWCYIGDQNGGVDTPGTPFGRTFSVRYGKRGFKTDKCLSSLEIWDGTPLVCACYD